MALIITPGQLSRLAEFYHQLGSMLTAGVTLTQALEQIEQAPPSLSFRKPIRALLGHLAHGMTFSEAVSLVPGWLPSFDLALLNAGEQSGRLDTSFRVLAGYYTDRARLLREVIAAIAYPLVIIHAAVVLAALPQFVIQGSKVGFNEVFPAFLRQTLVPLGLAWLAFFVLAFACQGRRGFVWRGVVERLFRRVPILGKARRHLALSRLSMALDSLLNAGVTVSNAWPLAAAASGSPALQRAVARWRPQLQAGTPPGDLLKTAPEFPDLFANLYSTGETSGTIDDTLKRLQQYYQEDAGRKMQALAQWVPRLIYVGILIVLAMQVINFWTNYYGGMVDRVDELMRQ